MASSKIDPRAEAFFQRLREANAEDLRNRILTSAKVIIEKGGLLPERLCQVPRSTWLLRFSISFEAVQ